jgi:hypothetical protein
VPPAAVAGAGFERTKAIIDLIDRAPVLGGIERQMGAFFGSFTSQIPRRAINLNDPTSIDKFVDLGRVMGMPADVRDAWKAMILDQSNVAGRIVAVESYLDTMLQAAGLHALPEGIELSKRFLVKYHQGYALNGLDELWVAGRPRRVGLMPVTDQAIELHLPDLKELRQAVQRGTVLKYLLGATDYSLVDTAMSKVWKPAVLLRLGFIPRAAGEELLAHIARNGVAGLVREWGETSVYRGEVASNRELAKLHYGVNDVGQFDDAMRAEMERWRVASHLRPVERLASRIGGDGNVVVRAMEDYTRWLRGMLDRGVLGASVDRLPANLRDKVLGDRRSLMRYLAEGTDPEVMEAMTQFHSRHARAMVAQISSRTAGLWEVGAQDRVVTHLSRLHNGELVEEQYVRVKDQFRFYGMDDPLYYNGAHEQINHVISDPVVARALNDTMLRVLPRTDNPQALLDAFGGLVNSARISARDPLDPVTIMLRELIGVDELDANAVARMQQAFLSDGVTPPWFDDVYAGMTIEEFMAIPRSRILGRVPDADNDAFNEALNMIDAVRQLDDNTHAWFATFWEHGSWEPDDLIELFGRAGDNVPRYFDEDGTFLGLGDFMTTEAMGDTPRFFLTEQQGRAAMRTRLAEILQDPQYAQHVGDSLRAAVVGGTPVLNPIADGFQRVYVPAIPRDHLIELQSFLEENVWLLPEMGVSGGGVQAQLVDDLMLRFEMVRESSGLPRAGADELAKVRQTFTGLVDNRDSIQVLVREAGLVGFNDAIPIVHGGVLDGGTAQNIADTIGQMFDPAHNIGKGRVGYVDEVRVEVPDHLQPADGLPRRNPAMLVEENLMRFNRAQLVPRELVRNGQVYSSTEDAVARWVDLMAERVEQVAQRQRTVMVPREGVFATMRDGTAGKVKPEDLFPVSPLLDDVPDPTIARRNMLDPKQTYYDEAGNKIVHGDPRYMRPVADQVGDPSIAWQMTGPALRDALDSIKGTYVLDAQGNRVLRSTVDQIRSLPANELPSHVLAASQVLHKQGSWDKAIEFGFDKVISPSIDAIVRTPLAKHLFIEAYLENKKAMGWLIDTKLRDELGSVIGDPDNLLAMLEDSIKVPWKYASTHKRVQELYVEGLAENWTKLQQYRQSLIHAQETITEASSIRMLTNAMPFLDSHEIKSQFGDYARNLLPFWYAEENFLKRWAKTLKMAPEAVRKGQLTYMGMREVGLVRTDANGRDWFVYPGSGVLSEVLSVVPGLEALPIGAMLQAEPRNMLPGFNRIGVPSASPLITVPMATIVQKFPELQPLQRAVAGDIGLNRGVLRQFMPTQVMNFYEVLFGNADNSVRWASATLSAAAHMEAHGNGLPANATAEETDAYMRRLEEHARVIVLTQALYGFVAPGAPSQIVTGESALSVSGATGVGALDPGQLVSEKYRRLVQTLGLDEGTAAFLNEHNGTVTDMINPLAYAQGRSRSVSGAVLPMTQEAVDFYDDNADWMAELPMAGAWLLPPDKEAVGSAEQYAFSRQLVSGLRERQTPESFVTALKFREGATSYFAAKDQYMAIRNAAELAGDEITKGRADQQWEEFSTVFLAQHPIFARELQSSDGRERRGQIIEELRIAVTDPSGPRPWHFEDVQAMVAIFDDYKLRMRQFANDRSTATRAAMDQLKANYENTMGAMVVEFPHLEPLWTSVLRPESFLD